MLVLEIKILYLNKIKWEVGCCIGSCVEFFFLVINYGGKCIFVGVWFMSICFFWSMEGNEKKFLKIKFLKFEF